MMIYEGLTIRPERSMCKREDWIYFINSNDTSKLYRIRKDGEKKELIASFPKEYSCRQSYFIYDLYDKLFLLPEKGGNVNCFDCISEEFNETTIIIPRLENNIYFFSCMYENKIYMLSEQGHSVVINLGCNHIDNNVFDISQNSYYYNGHSWSDTVYAVTSYDNMVHVWDLNTKKVGFMQMGIGNVNLLDITYNGNDFFFLTTNGDVYRKNNNVFDCKLIFSSNELMERPFFGLVAFRELIFIIPRYADDLMVINSDGEIISSMNFAECHDKGGYVCSEYYICDHYLYLLPRENVFMHIVDMENMGVKKINMETSLKDYVDGLLRSTDR